MATSVGLTSTLEDREVGLGAHVKKLTEPERQVPPRFL